MHEKWPTQKQGNARHFKWKCLPKTEKCCHNLESRIIKMECMFNHIANTFKKYIIYTCIKLTWNQTNTG